MSKAEVYNDLDKELVNLFRVARDQGEKLKQLLILTPFAREEFELSYDKSDDPVEQARRTIARAFMGFGSNAHNQKTGFRANSNRSGTVPSRDWANYPDKFDLIINRLRGVVIENRDALEVMAAHDSPTTLHYVDPPYVAETRDSGEDYAFEMDDSDHRKLAIFLAGLKGQSILSGYRCDLYDALFDGWHREDKSALADGARKRVECLWFSPNFKLQKGFI
jgi:DNA adenine methylase